MASVAASVSATNTKGRSVVDHVFIENMAFNAVVGPDAWGRKDKQQQVLVSVKWYSEISGKDDINSTLSYSKMSKDIMEAIRGQSKGFSSVQAVMDLMLYVVVDKKWGGSAVELQVHLPKALLPAAGGLKYIRGYTPNEQSISEIPNFKGRLYPCAVIEDINAMCIIGINPHERETKQQVKLRLTIQEDLKISAPEGIKSHWQGLVKDALEIVEASSYQTVEALAANLGDQLIQRWPARAVTIYLAKPFAQAFVGGSGAQITRYR